MLDNVKKVWPVFLYPYSDEVAKEVLHRIVGRCHPIDADRVRLHLYQLFASKERRYHRVSHPSNAFYEPTHKLRNIDIFDQRAGGGRRIIRNPDGIQ